MAFPELFFELFAYIISFVGILNRNENKTTIHLEVTHANSGKNLSKYKAML